MYNKCYVCGDRSEECRLTCFLVFRYNTTLPTKVPIVKAMVFPVVMYGCKGWTIKKAEHRGINAFELWCWRRLLRDPWTARRSNQSILKEINLGFSLEGMMLKLRLQYFGISPSKEHPGLISFRKDWLDLLEVQGDQTSPF